MATVLITTGDLEAANRIRAAFQGRPEDDAIFVAGPKEARAALEGKEAEQSVLVLTGDLTGEAQRRVSGALTRDGRGPGVLALVPDGRTPSLDLMLDLGIDETITLPVDPDEVVLVVYQLLERKRIQSETGIIGQTEAIREVLERLAQIAPVGSTVLITGESGTGKELVARGLHHLSRRRGKPFIAVNVAAVPETLLESELFGHEKGAFTGASSLRKGLFELANGGTIFLDEIGEMPRATQTKLLRVLEQREFMRVGGDRPIHVDVRVIAATNQNLRHAVQRGDFRRDLYYRLAVLQIDLPPLRERRADIPLLVKQFIREFSREHDRSFQGIAPEALQILVQYDWPGNVRELRNLIESMVVLAPGSVIRPEDIPSEVRHGSGRAMLPTPSVPVASRRGESVPAPEMEFIFRTLVELKLDMEDLRRQFEVYKQRHPELLQPVVSEATQWVEVTPEPSEREEKAEVGEEKEPEAVPAASAQDQEEEEEEEEGAITFRPGMSIQELERAAIAATLQNVGGNRRKAAESLGIGERTLYRKLKEYDIQE